MRRVAMVLVAAAALTGCGGTQKDVAYAPTPVASGCPATASPVAATAFPTNVPLPPGAVVTGYEQRSGGRQILTGVASGGFRPTLEFMQKAYPQAGLTLGEGEVEAGDAESNFAGNGLTGRWTLKDLRDCGGATLVTVLVAAS
jgi:hypothetical protein